MPRIIPAKICPTTAGNPNLLNSSPKVKATIKIIGTTTKVSAIPFTPKSFSVGQLTVQLHALVLASFSLAFYQKLRESKRTPINFALEASQV
jgi:hypothetical protein